MPAVGLARESSDAANKEMAYSYQIERLQEYGCQWIYGDRVSGRRDDRSGLEQALDKIRSGEADELVVTHFTRLARSVITAHRVVQLLKKHKAVLTVLDSPIDTSTPEGRFAFQMRAGLAELEAELGVERQLIGWQNSREKGRPRAPVFGYLISDGKYIPDEENWDIARSIVDQYLDIHSLHAVATWVQAVYSCLKENVRQRRPPYTARGVKVWLLNPVLAGHVVFSNGKRHLNQHRPLLSDGEQQQIRSIISSKVSGIERTGERKFAYSGLVYCAVCGARCTKITVNSPGHMPKPTGQSSEPNYLYYRCGKARYKQCTNTKRVRAEIVDIATLDAISNHAESIVAYLEKGLQAEPEKVNDPRILQLQSEIDQLLGILSIAPNVQIDIDAKQDEIRRLQNDGKSPSHDQLKEGLKVLVSLSEKKVWSQYSGREKGDRLRLIIKRILVADYQVQQIEFLPWISIDQP